MCLARRVRTSLTGRSKSVVRTGVQLHRYLSVSIILLIRWHPHGNRSLGAAFLACGLRTERRALVGLAHDLLKRLELVGGVDDADSDTGLLAMLEVVCTVGNVLLWAAA